MTQITGILRTARASIFVIATFAGNSAYSEPDTQAGEVFYQQQCASCHGDQGQGNSQLKSPALAAQRKEYLERQISHFAGGQRGSHPNDVLGQQMVAMALLIPDQSTTENVSAYLAGLPLVKFEQPDGNLENGYKYYQSCGSCHGAKAQGNEAFSAPRLAGLSAEYLKRQHANFIDGIRGFHQDDRYGRQMSMMAKTMTDDNTINDVVAYIVSLSDQ